MRIRQLGFEPLERRDLLAVEFRMLALIYPEVELGGVRTSMTPELIAAHKKAIQNDFPQTISQIVGDQVTARVHVEVSERVLDSLVQLNGRYEYAVESSIEEELDLYTQSGWYDHVIVIHGFDDATIGPSSLWGGGSTLRYGMSLATLSYGSLATDLAYYDFSAAAIHEWIHGLESQYFFYRQVPTGSDPNGGGLDLHDAELFGYKHDGEGRAAWLTWYRDFLTGRIRNLHSDGADTGLGFGTDVWELGPPRQDVETAPGSPLDLLDVSLSSVTLLSNAYWASSSSSSGTIERLGAADSSSVSIGNLQFDNGVVLNADGEIVVNLLGRTQLFEAMVGIDDEIDGGGSVVFELIGDGQVVWTSDALQHSDSALPVSVNVLGINQLKLVVKNSGGRSNDKAVWADAKFHPFTGDYISDTQWIRSSNGNGTIGLDRSIDWKPIRVEDASYGKGIGVHANSEIVVNLDAGYKRFQADVGIAEDFQFGGSVEFEVYLDNRLAYSSGLKTANDSISIVDIDVSSAQQLRLVVTDAGDGINGDNAVWAGARLLRQSTLGSVGITVSSISGNTTEADGTATFTVVLTSEPTSNITIPLSSSDTTEGTVVPTRLTFTPANWNVAQTVSVTGVDDNIDDGDIAFAILTGVAIGGDYAGLDATDVAVTNSDNDDPPTVMLSHNSTNIAEAAGASVITATLSIASSFPVTIDLGFTGAATLTSDYMRTGTQIVIPAGQTTGAVTVTAVQDTLDEVDETIIVDITGVANGTEVTPEQQVTVAIIDDDEPLDFGDAPSAYPITLAQDGARHSLGPLFLGETVDPETDGTPSVNADSDDGDNGVFVLTTLITTDVATASSFSVIASQPGKLDAWIDFNGDNDWNDAGEQIFASRDVEAGVNTLGFTVPASASVGTTAARFRISTTGGLLPTGQANDGEVEDRLVTIVDGDTAADVSVQLPGGETSVTIEIPDEAAEGESPTNTTLVVRTGTQELLRVPPMSVASIRLIALPQDDIVSLMDLSAIVGRALTVFADGGDGNDTLRLLGADFAVDLTGDGGANLQNFEMFDIIGDGNNSLKLDADQVLRLSPATGTLLVRSDPGDSVEIGGGWGRIATEVVDGEFVRVVSQQAATLRLIGPNEWSNPVDPHDVNNDGSVSALDALTVINELNRQRFSDLQQLLVPASTTGPFPNMFFDVNRDARASAIDALLVINFLNRRDFEDPAGENLSTGTSPTPLIAITLANHSIGQPPPRSDRGFDNTILPAGQPNQKIVAEVVTEDRAGSTAMVDLQKECEILVDIVLRQLDDRFLPEQLSSLELRNRF